MAERKAHDGLGRLPAAFAVVFVAMAVAVIVTPAVSSAQCGQNCPVHAITEIGERRYRAADPPLTETEDPAEHLKTEDNEAEWGFTR